MKTTNTTSSSEDSKNFDYSCKEFFYDKSFNDYPSNDLFEILEIFINRDFVFPRNDFYHTPSSWISINRDKLLHLATYILNTPEMQYVKLENFVEESYATDISKLRIIQYHRNSSNLPLSDMLKIMSIDVHVEKRDQILVPKTITIIAHSETNFETLL